VAVAKRVARVASDEERPARRSPVIWLAAGAVLALVVVGIVGASALSSFGTAGGTQAVPPATLAATPEGQVGLVATATLLPATATPATSAECPGVNLLGFQEAGNEVSWTIYNGLANAIRVRNMQFALPKDNSLQDVLLGGVSLVDPDSLASGNTIPDLEALGGEHTQVSPGATLPLLLRYSWPDERTGELYRVAITFDAGCLLDTAW
jgi:hypothetical protein